ncbi:hypothetical protein Pmani_013599 [Petrolisthes manimaculis]|uniref:Uncharacterized protein n=1 Tax=Petrolisthes manimaculis TaxID=1843537 RepID=A0AAE1PUV0_9EUCA|nr:hypothetical protein Pmani_013599 [Petrolisthes manimaculis]
MDAKQLESQILSCPSVDDITGELSDPCCSPDHTEGRPSILITFQNSASYYTSYMGGGGTRGAGGNRRKNSDVNLPQQHCKEHPIVIMNDYPTPPPLSVAVSSRKQSYDRNFKEYSSGPPTPPKPQGPPGPPGPPMPNLPPSRRESFSTNTLELPRSRRGSVSPSTGSRGKSPSTQSRGGQSSGMDRVPSTRLHVQQDQCESSTLPRTPKLLRPPCNSQSMPTFTEVLENGKLEAPNPSPRPSVCSSGMTETQTERRPLMTEYRSSVNDEDWSPPPPILQQPKPNWLSLSMSEAEHKSCQPQSVYVAEIWPSLVCILTAVLMTLIVYILVSYYYSYPHPNTKNRISPSMPVHPAAPTPYPYPYPYFPPPYEHFPPPYQYPNQPPPHPPEP